MKKIGSIFFALTILVIISNSAQAAESSADSTWYNHELKLLWESHIENDLEYKHLEEKISSDKNAKTLYRNWIKNSCLTPGDKPYIAAKPSDGHSSDTVPVFHGSPKADGKPILNPPDAATVQFTVELNHDRLEKAYSNYTRAISEDKQELAKKTLVEMCGAEAVKRLDARIYQKSAESERRSKSSR